MYSIHLCHFNSIQPILKQYRFAITMFSISEVYYTLFFNMGFLSHQFITVEPLQTGTPEIQNRKPLETE